MLDKLKRSSAVGEDDQKTLSNIGKKMKVLQVMNKKQKSIKTWFT